MQSPIITKYSKPILRKKITLPKIKPRARDIYEIVEDINSNNTRRSYELDKITPKSIKWNAPISLSRR